MSQILESRTFSSMVLTKNPTTSTLKSITLAQRDRQLLSDKSSSTLNSEISSISSTISNIPLTSKSRFDQYPTPYPNIEKVKPYKSERDSRSRIRFSNSATQSQINFNLKEQRSLSLINEHIQDQSERSKNIQIKTIPPPLPNINRSFSLNRKIQLNTNLSKNYKAASQVNLSINGLNEFSPLELEILKSKNPIEIKESDKIVVNNQKGIWVNKTESLNWKGPIPLQNYKIKQDSEPIILKRKPTQKVRYIQDVFVKYLTPPKPPKPGDIIIRHEPDRQIRPAPPVIIRQTRPKPVSPPPLIIREEPPKPPPKLASKIINISGRTIPPPPRRLIIERLPKTPSKPRSILIERWLPYSDLNRKIIYHKPPPPALYPEPKNLIIEWDKPDVEVVANLKHMGIFEQDPSEYRKKFSNELKASDKLPDFVLNIPTPSNLVLAMNHQGGKVKFLGGDVDALRLINLEKVGLEDYKDLLDKSKGDPEEGFMVQNDPVDLFIQDLFRGLDQNNLGYVNIGDAENVFINLNNRFRRTNKNEIVRELFKKFELQGQQTINIEEFTNAFHELTK